MVMDIRKIQKLIKLIVDKDIGEIEIRKGDESVRISRQVSALPAQSYVAPIMPTASMPHKVEEEKTKAQEKIEEGHVVKSPMVGTVYLSKTPGAEPFVSVGQHVETGSVLCLVEAMKMYNQILADRSGKISARLVENGQPVEFDQPLFIIE